MYQYDSGCMSALPSTPVICRGLPFLQKNPLYFTLPSLHRGSQLSAGVTNTSHTHIRQGTSRTVCAAGLVCLERHGAAKDVCRWPGDDLGDDDDVHSLCLDEMY